MSKSELHPHTASGATFDAVLLLLNTDSNSLQPQNRHHIAAVAHCLSFALFTLEIAVDKAPGLSEASVLFQGVLFHHEVNNFRVGSP